MNIYITPANKGQLQKVREEGRSMSGLVNELLAGHFAKDWKVLTCEHGAGKGMCKVKGCKFYYGRKK